MPILVKHVPHYHKFLRASEIMNPHVVSLKAVDSVENIQTAITTNNHHGFPIVNNAERAVGYISKNYLVILLRERRFYDKQEVELANSQAVLHNHDEDLDDPYACSDMLDLAELPISKVPELDWTYFKRSYTS